MQPCAARAASVGFTAAAACSQRSGWTDSSTASRKASSSIDTAGPGSMSSGRNRRRSVSSGSCTGASSSATTLTRFRLVNDLAWKY